MNPRTEILVKLAIFMTPIYFLLKDDGGCIRPEGLTFVSLFLFSQAIFFFFYDFFDAQHGFSILFLNF